MKRSVLPIVIILLIATATLVTYRVYYLEYPVFPAAPLKIWHLQFESHINGGNSRTTLLLALPTEQHGQRVLDEYISSGILTFSVLQEQKNRIGVWSGTMESFGEWINYRATILSQSRQRGFETLLSNSYPLAVSQTDQKHAVQLTGQWNALAPPARLRQILLYLKQTYGKTSADSGTPQALPDLVKRYSRETLILTFLKAASVPAETVEGFKLTDAMGAKPEHAIRAWTGRTWEFIDIELFQLRAHDTPFLVLSTGGMSVARISDGALTEPRWNINHSTMDQWRLKFEQIKKSDHFLDRWSLFHLPAEFQQTFRFLLLIPLGALLIGLLRNLIGFPTFGIFMPVLMALAFRNTGLVYGLAMFAGIIVVGYMARWFLDRFRLLLVPRMSVLLTLVIILFTLLAMLGNKIGLREIMAVGLLPFVILSMTIERFFIIVEEHDITTAVKTAAGSAAVSVITYVIISWEPLQLTFFVYPELLFTMMASQILLGRYTGYRLSELIRFRSFMTKDDN